MNGRNGETYNVGGSNEKTNLEVVQSLCEVLDERVGKQPGGIESYKDLITFVTDRPGHDARYAVNAQKIQKELDWSPTETFDTGIRKTVDWYLENQSWCRSTMDDTHRYERLGVAV
jgi:dTDP-glucose 4,6-dehydratase